MVLVEVDVVGLEPFEAPSSARRISSREPIPRRAAAAELRRQDDPVPPPAERLTEERLALPVAVALGRVEERDADLERRVDDRARPASSTRRPKLLQPRPTTETSSVEEADKETGGDGVARSPLRMRPEEYSGLISLTVADY